MAKAGLIVLMALGSLILWIGSPLGWLWVASQLQGSTDSGIGPYALVLLGILFTAFALAKGLSQLNDVYGDVSGDEPVVQVRMPWNRSLRGEQEGRAPRTVLDVVMVISVTLGAIVLSIWFFFFAGSSLPTN